MLYRPCYCQLDSEQVLAGIKITRHWSESERAGISTLCLIFLTRWLLNGLVEWYGPIFQGYWWHFPKISRATKRAKIQYKAKLNRMKGNMTAPMHGHGACEQDSHMQRHGACEQDSHMHRHGACEEVVSTLSNWNGTEFCIDRLFLTYCGLRSQ